MLRAVLIAFAICHKVFEFVLRSTNAPVVYSKGGSLKLVTLLSMLCLSIILWELLASAYEMVGLVQDTINILISRDHANWLELSRNSAHGEDLFATDTHVSALTLVLYVNIVVYCFVAHVVLSYLHHLYRRQFVVPTLQGVAVPIAVSVRQHVAQPTTSPQLPPELWTMVVGLVIRVPGATSVEIEDPFSGAGDDAVDSKVCRDRRALLLVSRVVRSVVLEVWVEHFVIRHGNDLENVAKILQGSHAKTPGSHLGLKTRRIDLVITGPYDPSHLATILRLTPNLLVLVNMNNYLTKFVASAPAEIVRAIIEHGTSIERLEFRSTSESLSLFDVTEISYHLLLLKTLRLGSISSYPCYPPSVTREVGVAYFDNLETLVLDEIPYQADGTVPEHYFVDWNLFLSYLGSDYVQLPALRRLDVTPFVDVGSLFLQVHGKQIRTLCTSTFLLPPQLMTSIAGWGGVESLVLTHTSAVAYFTNVECGSIKRISIVPRVKETSYLPHSVTQSAVLTPLGQLLQELSELSLPNLCEIRVCDVGLYAGVTEHSLLGDWNRYFNTRGVQVVDRMGMPIRDPNEE